jgi:NADP-dependent 3-hydroxy acid dehydrogenase YdfG
MRHGLSQAGGIGTSRSVKNRRVPHEKPVSESKNPVLLITGASSGIGAATARAAVDRYRLVLAARRVEALEDLAAELGGPDTAIAVACDVTEWDQCSARR